MKPPLLTIEQVAKLGTDADYAVLPAVTVLAAGGFLSCSLPVIRLRGRGSSARGERAGPPAVYVLVPYEARGWLWSDHSGRQADKNRGDGPFWNDIDAGGFPRWFAGGGQRDRGWLNAEALWVRAEWLRDRCAEVVRTSHAIAMLRRACEAALEE